MGNEGSQREEKYNVYSPAKFAFSLVSLGATAMGGIYAYMRVKEDWNSIYKGVENYVKTKYPTFSFGKPKIPTYKSTSLMSYYSREYRSSAVELAEKFIKANTGTSDAGIRYANDHSLAQVIMVSADITEIAELQNDLSINSSSRGVFGKYVEGAISDTFPPMSNVYHGNIKEYLVEHPEYIPKYKRALRKYRRVLSNMDPFASVAQHVEAIKSYSKSVNLTGDMPAVMLDFSQVAYKPLDIHVNVPGRASKAGYERFNADMNTLKSMGYFQRPTSFDRILYNPNKLKLVDTMGKLDTLYRSLESNLRTMYQSSIHEGKLNVKKLMEGAIEHSFIDEGNGELSIKFTIRTPNLTPNDSTDPIKIHRLDSLSTNVKEITIPIGRTDTSGDFSITVNNTKYVKNKLRKEVAGDFGDTVIGHSTITTDIIDNLTNNMHKIAEAATRPDGEKVINSIVSDAKLNALSHATMSGGYTLDVAAATTVVYPDIWHMAPTNIMTKSSRARLERQLQFRQAELRTLDSGYNKELNTNLSGPIVEAYSGARARLVGKIANINAMLDQGRSSSDRLLKSYRAMLGTMYGEEFEGGIPWFVGAGHIGSSNLISPLGYSLYTYIVNPQTQPHQLSNVHVLREEARTRSVIRYLHPNDNADLNRNVADITDKLFTKWEKRATTTANDLSYRKEWAGVILSDLYPFSEAGAVVDQSLMRTMSSNIISGEQGTIPIPKDSINYVKNHKLREALYHIQNMGPSLDKGKVLEYLDTANITISPNTTIYDTPYGVRVPHRGQRARVIDIAIEDGNIILKTQRAYIYGDPMRLRDITGAVKTTPLVEHINSQWSDLYGQNISILAKGDIKRKVTNAMYDGLTIEGALEHAVDNVEILKRTGVTGTPLATKIKDIGEAVELLGGQYDVHGARVYLRGIHYKDAHFIDGLVDAATKLEPHIRDRVLTLLGHTYSADDPLIRLIERDSESASMIRKYLHNRYKDTYSGDALEDMINNVMPAAQGPRLFAYANGFITRAFMTRIAAMHQPIDTISKVFGIDKPPSEGIPFKWHELKLFSHAWVNVHPANSALHNEPAMLADKLAASISTQFGGSKAMDEYRDLLNVVTGRSIVPDGKILTMDMRKNSKLMELLEQINRSMDRWKGGSYPILGNPDDALEALGTTFDIESMLKQFETGDIDIRGLMGQWVELPKAIMLKDGITTKYVKIPDIRKMKVKPTTVREANEYFMHVGRAFKSIFEVITGRAGTGYSGWQPNAFTAMTEDERRNITSARVNPDSKISNIHVDDRNVFSYEKSLHSGLSMLTPEEGEWGIKGRKLYVDIETTGVRTAEDQIFMIGMTYEQPGTGGLASKTVQKQLFAHTAAQEETILQSFSKFANNFDVLYTYNGKRFDLNMLNARMLKHKISRPNIGHVDLMDTWSMAEDKRQVRNMKLTTLIEKLTGIKRAENAPGAIMPDLYKMYLTGTPERRAEILAAFKEHNVEDLVDMASLHSALIKGGNINMPGFTPAQARDITNMWGDIINDPDKLIRSGGTLLDAYTTMLSHTLGRKGFIRESVMGARLPGIQGIISALPESWGSRAQLGPMDIGIVKQGDLWRGLRKNIYNQLLTKYVGEDGKFTKDVRKSALNELHSIERGERKYGIITGRHPITGPQARAVAFLKVMDIEKEALAQNYHLRNLLFPSMLMQMRVQGDLDADIIQAIIGSSWADQDTIEQLAKYDTSKGGMAYKIATELPEYEWSTDRGKNTLKYKSDLGVAMKGVLMTEGKPDYYEVRVPKAFSVRRIGDTHRFNVLIHDTVRDERTGDMRLANVYMKNSDADRGVNSDGFKNMTIKMSDGTNQEVQIEVNALLDLMQEQLEQGKDISAGQVKNILNTLGTNILDVGDRPAKLLEMANKTLSNQMRNMLVLQSQKGMTGSSTAYIMALNTLAQQELGGRGAANITAANFNMVQNFLSAKKWNTASMGEVVKKLNSMGEYVEAVANVSTLDDYYGKQLHLLISGEDTMKGLLSKPDLYNKTRKTIEDITSIARSKRVNVWNGTSDIRNLLLSTNDDKERSLAKLASIMSAADDFISGKGQNIELGEMLEQMGLMGGVEFDPSAINNVVSNAVTKTEWKYPTGLGPTRKPLFGPFKWGNLQGSATDVDNTMIADTFGKTHGAAIKMGAVGLGLAGSLYLAFNFFRPNQMHMLGTQPGLGGETWSYLRGARTELPWRVPIDTPSYTWQAPPYDNSRRARVTPFNPILADKLNEFRSTVRNNIMAPVFGAYVGPPPPRTYGTTYRNDRYSSTNAMTAARGSYSIAR
jgi:uncharacterized protein YprB with RNaseH-like and TPR domain